MKQFDERVYNFSAGPSALPESVLKTAAAEMTNYQKRGLSVMEMSHRSKEFIEIIEETERLLRSLMSIPEGYSVLFLQGGATTQFAMIPLNLLTKSKNADFFVTGFWSEKALSEASLYGSTSVVGNGKDSGYCEIPPYDASKFNKNADYFHLTMNNTIYGTKINALPETNGVPIVADWSSSILSEACDVSRYGLIYAGAQKNIGPSGLTVVVIKDSLLENACVPETVPTILRYETHTASGSMYNTPPTYAIYIAMHVFKWLEGLGGVSEMEKINREKARILYDYLDNSSIFKAKIPNERDRSLMNVVFSLPTAEHDADFAGKAAKSGLIGLKGHRAAGGLRASLYNAVTIKGVTALVNFMKDYEKQESRVSNV